MTNEKPRAGETDRRVSGADDITLERVGKVRKGFTRHDKKGREHYVEPHVQRYWHGGRVAKKIPREYDIELAEDREKIRRARLQYYNTTSLGQRLWDKSEYATIDVKGKLQPGIFGREDIYATDSDGNYLTKDGKKLNEYFEILDSNNNPTGEYGEPKVIGYGSVPIEDWQFDLWQNRPNQYDIFKVDDPLPKNLVIKQSRKFDPDAYSQDIRFQIFDKEKGTESWNELGHMNLDITRRERDVWNAQKGKMEKKITYTGTPYLGVGSKHSGKGLATYLIREAIDFSDINDVRASIQAVPDPEHLEFGEMSFYNPETKKIESVDFDESDEGFHNRVSDYKVQLRDMYVSYGVTDAPTRAEIEANPSDGFSMARKPYSEIESEILRKREIKQPNTAEYKQRKKKRTKQ